jgi:hypothetical protein
MEMQFSPHQMAQMKALANVLALLAFMVATVSFRKALLAT